MYSNKNILYIVSAISAIEKINDYTKEYTSWDILLSANNQLNFNGAITLLISIAEETKKIDQQLLNTETHIVWKSIVDMRNVLAHDYRGTDPEIVFDVITNDLPKLKIAFVQLLKQFSIEAVEGIVKTERYQHLQKIIF